MATKRRQFTAKFKVQVAMEALRGDRPIQAIAAKHAGARWTAAAGVWTTRSSNGCGDR